MGWIPSNDVARNEALAAFCDGVLRTRQLVDAVMIGGSNMAGPCDPANEQPNGGIWKKLASVMAKVDRIPKNGFNSFLKYNYATEADITEGVRGILAGEGIAFLPSVMSWERGEPDARGNCLTRVQVKFTLADTGTGQTIESLFWGEGQDNQDKGFYKAYTGAVKYFLLKTLLIPTGDDPEEGGEPQAHRQQPAAAAPRPPQAPRPATPPRAPGPAAKVVDPELVGKTIARAVDAGLTLDNLLEFVRSSVRPVKDLTELTVTEFHKVISAVDAFVKSKQQQEG